MALRPPNHNDAGRENLRSPREASNGFFTRIDAVPRVKFAFYVEFVGGKEVASKLGFVAKSVDRPSVQFETQELNQYNRRRIVYTGIKYQPVNITIYDTVDSTGLHNWNYYAQHYFGDFRHKSVRDWDYDVTGDQMPDGYGFAPQLTAAANYLTASTKSNHYFDAVNIYQPFGREYSMFTLVKPRITAIAPDEMSYESSDPATIRITLAYEAVIIQAKRVSWDEASGTFKDAFTSGQLDGDTFDQPGTVETQPATQDPDDGPPGVSPQPVNEDDVYGSGQLGPGQWLNPDTGQPYGGETVVGSRPGAALAPFGAFNFGGMVAAGVNRMIGSAVSGGLNSLMAKVGFQNSKGIGGSLRFATDPLGNVQSQLTVGIPGARFAMASNALGSSASVTVARGLASGILSASLATRMSPANLVSMGGARPAVPWSDPDRAAKPWVNPDAPAAQWQNPDDPKPGPPGNSRGIALASSAYGAINDTRPSYSQIGYNADEPYA